jgi:hypothetical protein
VLDQRARRVEQGRARAARIGAARTPAQQASHALGRIRERRLEPIVERTLEQPRRLVGRRNREQRVDARLDGAFLEQIAAERVDRRDARELELLERGVEPAPLGAACGGRRARELELGTQPQPHLARRLVRERERDDAVERRATAAQQRHDATHERRGLARARRRLDE